jgi:putative transposase
VFVTPKERNRLPNFASKLSAKVLHQLVTIVHPETLLRWLREERRGKHKLESANRGRPKTAAQLRRLILMLARENDWGYTRIMGEIKKLGIKPPSRNTVKNILKAAGLDPGPQRGEATWDEFLTRHAASLWQCDFFSRNLLTPRGYRQVFVLAFLNVETRRVILSPATYQPDAEWVEAQAQAFVAQARDAGLPVARVMRDRDSKFSEAFDEALRRHHVKVVKTQFRAPNCDLLIAQDAAYLRHLPERNALRDGYHDATNRIGACKIVCTPIGSSSRLPRIRIAKSAGMQSANFRLSIAFSSTSGR